MTKLRVLDLFSGIGGFSLGLERATNKGQINGFETVAFCEIEAFPRKVLAKHWPDVPCYTDVRTLTAERLAADGIAVDVICGGFPCQDISTAGKQGGLSSGTRSGLWSEIVRLASEVRPRFIIVENVAALLSGPSERPGEWFGVILGDLAALGYDAEWHCIPASHLGAHHQRDRIWIIAYSDADSLRLQRVRGSAERPWSEEQLAQLVQVALQSTVSARSGGGIHDGIPDRAHRLKGLGNAVVPQIPELIGNSILEAVNT